MKLYYFKDRCITEQYYEYLKTTNTPYDYDGVLISYMNFKEKEKNNATTRNCKNKRTSKI